MLQQLVGWHSRHVNPRELTVSPRWLADAAKHVGRRYPLTLLGLTLYQYRGETKLSQTRPNPDISRSVGLPELA
eukprot:2340922-Karenia_brevis.AAC.1